MGYAMESKMAVQMAAQMAVSMVDLLDLIGADLLVDCLVVKTVFCSELLMVVQTASLKVE
jgi:hypothetical protein